MYPNTLEHGERAVDALKDAGLRAVYTYGPPGDDVAKWWYESDVGLPEGNVRELYDGAIRDDDLLSLAIGLRGPDFCSDETAVSDLELARDLDAIATIHMGAPCGPPPSTPPTTRGSASTRTCSVPT